MDLHEFFHLSILFFVVELDTYPLALVLVGKLIGLYVHVNFLTREGNKRKSRQKVPWSSLLDTKSNMTWDDHCLGRGKKYIIMAYAPVKATYRVQ